MRHFFQRLSAKVDAISPKIIILLLIFTLALLSVAAIVNAFIPDSTPTAPEASASSPPNLLPTIDFSQYEPTVQPSPTRPPPTNTPIPRTPPLTPGPEAGANFAAQPPTPTPTPTPPPTPPGQAGICKRTPEVQDAIIAAIAELGPRMSCQLINPSELYRIREMTVSETSLLSNDLEDLPNLRQLTISINGRIERDTFAKLTGLRSLDIKYLPGRPPHLIPGTFDGLSHLQSLTITLSERAKFTLDRKTLRGLHRLKDLSAGEIAGVSSDAFDHLPSLINVSLTAPQAHEYDQPLLPDRLLHPALALERASFTNFQTPTILDLATPKAACYAIGSQTYPGWAAPSTTIQAAGQTAELLDWSQTTDNTHTCKLIIGGARIAEIPIPIT